MKTPSVLLATTLVALLVPSLALADDCTSIPSVAVSRLVTHNNDYGGHLNAHVRGQTPPNNYTQAGKTMFSDSMDWDDAYGFLATQDPALQCNTAAPIDSEAARTLPFQLFSQQCTAATGAGVCTASHSVQTNYVTYVMRVVANNGGRRWILYTAYPIQ